MDAPLNDPSDVTEPRHGIIGNNVGGELKLHEQGLTFSHGMHGVLTHVPAEVT